MRYNWKLLLSTLIFSTILGDVQPVSARRIPSKRPNRARRQNATPQGVKVSGLNVLQQYVCPSSCRNVKRQAGYYGIGSSTVTIPRSQLQELLNELRLLEMELVALINEGFALEVDLLGAAASSSEAGAAISGVLSLFTPSGSSATVVSVAVMKTTAHIMETNSPAAGSIPLAYLSAAMNSALLQPLTSPPTTITTAYPEKSVCRTTTTLQYTVTSTVPAVIITGPGAVASSTAWPSDGCNQDDCLQAFEQESGQAFCSTFTTGVETATAVLPSYPTACTFDSSVIFRASSACSCLNQSPAAISTAIGAASSTLIVVAYGTAEAVDNTPIAAASSTTVGTWASVAAISTTATATTGGVCKQSSTSSAETQAATGSSDTTGYVFNAQSSENVAVYFGQTAATSLTALAEECADPNIDIIIVAFVISQLDGGPYPQVNFGAACGGQTTTMENEAPGLLYCPELASNISACQSTYGKKVLLSIGGSASGISFTSAEEASNFANMLWNLFGPPGNIDLELRPFGTVTVDGFDVDNEDNDPDNYDTLATTFRSLYSAASETYYLSSAPQCPYPDASNPMGLLLLCDFVWVQFYNNEGCQIGSSGFNASVHQWSSELEASTMETKPRLYVGAPAFSAAGSTAYEFIASGTGMETVAQQVKGYGLDNLGGIMFWDGSEGIINVEAGKDIIAWAKMGLTQ